MSRERYFYSDPTASAGIARASEKGSRMSIEEFNGLPVNNRLALLGSRKRRFPDDVRASLLYEARKEKALLRRRQRR